MGNEAAHQVTAHSEADLMTALDVVEYLLKGEYILPRLASKLPKKGQIVPSNADVDLD
jgi:hypothetical protein